MTAATDCHETVMVATLNIRARFEPYPNSPGFSDEPGLFFASSLRISLYLWLPPKAKPPSPFAAPCAHIARGVSGKPSTRPSTLARSLNPGLL